MLRKSVLIVEDESVIALDIQNMLELEGYEVPGLLSTGEDAIARIEDLKPDLIVMDIILQGEMDGITAIEEIKKKHDIPFVYMTAHIYQKVLKRAKATRPHGYILKPIKHRELCSVIEKALYEHVIGRKLTECPVLFTDVV